MAAHNILAILAAGGSWEGSWEVSNYFAKYKPKYFTRCDKSAKSMYFRKKAFD